MGITDRFRVIVNGVATAANAARSAYRIATGRGVGSQPATIEADAKAMVQRVVRAGLNDEEIACWADGCVSTFARRRLRLPAEQHDSRHGVGGVAGSGARCAEDPELGHQRQQLDARWHGACDRRRDAHRWNPEAARRTAQQHRWQDQVRRVRGGCGRCVLAGPDVGSAGSGAVDWL